LKAPDTINIESLKNNTKAIQELKDKWYSWVENSRGKINFYEQSNKKILKK
jgi:hypothetical protein